MDNVVTGPVFLHSCLSKPDVLNLDENCSIGNLPLSPLPRHSNSLVHLSLVPLSRFIQAAVGHTTLTQEHKHKHITVCVCVWVHVRFRQTYAVCVPVLICASDEIWLSLLCRYLISHDLFPACGLMQFI